MALLDYFNPRKKKTGLYNPDDMDEYDMMNENNVANLVEPQSFPSESPAALATLQQANNPTPILKEQVTPKVNALNLNAMPSTQVGGTSNQYSIFPGGERPTTYRDQAMKDLGYENEKYAKRGIGAVLSDIGKGALRGIASGQGAIGGSVAGGLGQYRQADRTNDINLKAKDLQESSEDVRKNIAAANTQENTQSLAQSRNAKAQNDAMDLKLKESKVKAYNDYLGIKGKTETDKTAQGGRKVDLAFAKEMRNQIISQGPYMDPDSFAAAAAAYEKLTGVPLDQDIGENVLHTKQDAVPGSIYEDASNNTVNLIDRFGNKPPSQLEGLDSTKRWLQDQRTQNSMLKKAGGGKGPKSDDDKFTLKDIKSIIGTTTGYRAIPKKLSQLGLPAGGGDVGLDLKPRFSFGK